MAKKGTALGRRAVNQLGGMYSDWSREYENTPEQRRKPPVIGGSTIRTGILQADLTGQTTTPVIANETYFQRNDADAGSRGSWVNKLDNANEQITFLVIDYFMPASKKLLAGKKLGCVQIARDLYIPIVSECWT